MHCVPYSQNERLQYILLAMSIGPLYVIVGCYMNNFYISNLEFRWENNYLIQTESDVENKLTNIPLVSASHTKEQ